VLAVASLAACAAAISACLLAGGLDVGRLEILWESAVNRIDRVRDARRTLDELERKHGATPFERWPPYERARYVSAENTLRQLGEER
jgi:hypothetical protein